MTLTRPAVGVAALAYVAALHVVYQHSIAPAFTYLRYAYRDPDPGSYALAVVLVVALALLLPPRLVRPSHVVAWVLFVVAVVPAIVVPQFAPVLRVEDARHLAIWVAVSYLPVAVLGTRRVVRGSVPDLRMSPGVLWPLVTVVTGAVLAYVLASVGVRWELPALDEVYDVRAEFNVTEDADVALAYVVPLLGNVLNPLLVVRGLYSRRPVWVVAGVLGQLLIYSFAGYRTAILSPIALLVAYLLFRRTSRPPAALVLGGAAALVVLMAALDRLTSSIEFTSLLVRRFLVTPGLLTAGYVSVFGDIEKVRLSHSVLSSFFDYPYAQEPPMLVGAEFFGDPSTNANANLLADGFANFGYPGMVLACAVLTVLLWVVDAAADGLPVAVGALLYLMPALALADSGILTTMLTHGFLAAVVVATVLPETGWRVGPAPPRPVVGTRQEVAP